jgi:hypothetical protein
MVDIVNKNNFDFSRINPDFIYNRIDLFSDDYEIIHVYNSVSEFYLEIHLFNKYVELGSWMMSIDTISLNEIASFLFQRYSLVEYLSFHNTITNKTFITKNHFHLNLPELYKDLENRISSKGRYNINRNKKKAKERYGEFEFVEYSGNIPKEIVLSYFQLKKETHHIDYNLSVDDYLKRYHVTNSYILYFGGNIAAILFTCEQCPIVYLENLTYDIKYSQYSPGQIIYDLLLERLISKGVKSFYLEGGNYDYKKRYGSIETVVNDGRIYRSSFIHLKYIFVDFYNKHILWKLHRVRKMRII